MKIDLDPIVKLALKQFGHNRPTNAELKQFITGLGIAEAALILQALKFLWDIEQERKKKKASQQPMAGGMPTCCYTEKGKRCGAPIAHSEIEKEADSRFLIQICTKRHEMRLALPKRP